MKQDQQTNRLEPLPDNSDSEFWEDAETHIAHPRKVELCDTHGRQNWQEHHGYVDNHDGTVSCKFCSWGTKVPGYLKVYEDRLVDLRTFNK